MKTMNKTMILALVAMILLGAMQATAMTKFADVQVTMIQQSPDPVNPGDVVEVKFRIENNGSNTANNAKVRLGIGYPFTIYADTVLEKELGELPYTDGGDASVVKSWKLLVDPDAMTGTESVDVWFQINNQGWIKAGSYDVNIRSSNPFLAINKIESDPERIVPGTTTKVSFFLENRAGDDLKDITLTLTTYSEITTAAGVTVQELPFTAIRSGNEKSLSRIAKGKSNAITFDLFTDADADSKLYKVPFTLEYSDSAGNEYTRTGIIGLLVDSTPELTVYVDASEAQSAGSKGDVTIKFVNKGFSDMKFLDVELKETSDFKLLSTPQVYIGKLDSDDYETADYTIRIASEAKEQIMLPIHIDYRNANGELYTSELQLPLKLYSAEELKQNENSGSGWTIAIIVLIVCVAAFFIYRRWKKGKKR